ncbi:MAG: phosphoadenylyl-sulfate reductase [Campylobacterales bacterium]
MEDKVKDSIRFIQTWYQKYNNQAISTTSCGATASLMIDLISRSQCNIPIVFIDTGFLFEDTIDYFYRLRSIYNNLFFIRIRYDNDKDKFYSFADGSRKIDDTNSCCEINKVKALNDFIELNDIKCWFSALRRDQNSIRKDMEEFSRDKNGIYRVHPVIDWNSEEVFDYIKKRELPLHPLFDMGYQSIGCEPCTKKGSGRDGRWQGMQKTECGLHL